MITLLLLSLACTDPQDTADTGPLFLGPELSHTPLDAGVLEGEEIPVTVIATDDDGVGEVTLTYRQAGGAFWSSVELTADGDTWTGAIPGADVVAPGVEYYLKAVDLNSDYAASSYLPADTSQPFLVPVSLVGRPLPFHEGFELEGSANDLFGLGWANASQGFAGEPWQTTDSRVYAGETAVAHFRGSESGAALDDWLITPALDLAGVDEIELTWWQYNAAAELGTHSLWISTGARDPAAGEYVELDLGEPAGEQWERSAVVDLSAYSGERAVYLAWRYEGLYADDWLLDEVQVRELGPDLVGGFDWAPETVHPGDTVTLTVDLANSVDAVAEAVSVQLTLPEGAGTLSAETVEVGEIAGLGSAAAEFELSIDGAWPDNSYMPLEFEISSGDRSWSLSQELVVGLLSTGRLDLELSERGLVTVELGVGDPEAPTWEQQVFGETVDAGPLELEVDLTDQYELLPPEAGELRWYARVSSGAPGFVQSFEIEAGGETWTSSNAVALEAEQPLLRYLPEPPLPVLAYASNTPGVLSPGDLVTLSVGLENQGADSAGPVSVTLQTSDSDVTLIDAGPVILDGALWEAGAADDLSDAFSFQVSELHTDSSAVDLSLVLDDGVEQWALPLSLDVPWPVLSVTAVEIDDDDGGDGDGLLEPGETATLAIDLTNVGDLDAFGRVEGVLSVESTSTATATSSGLSDSFGTMSVGSTKDADFELSVDSGASLGDTLDLLLTLTDDSGSYEARTQIVLGELPWLTVAALDDDSGDSLGFDFDLKNARYRSDGSTFELIVESHAAFDPTTAFVEMWALATVADYSYYRLVFQSGSAKLQGYDSGFTTLSRPTVSYPDSSSVKMSWDVADMGITTTQLRVGFGSGWCGTETGSFCDHFPDGWGYYYGSDYYTSDFYLMKW